MGFKVFSYRGCRRALGLGGGKGRTGRSIILSSLRLDSPFCASAIPNPSYSQSRVIQQPIEQ